MGGNGKAIGGRDPEQSVGSLFTERIINVGGEDSSGNGQALQFNSAGELLVTQGTLTNSLPFLNVVFEDTSFVAGDSPVVLDFNAAAGRNSVDGYIINDGAGDFTVEFSRDGSTFGPAWTMKAGEMIGVRNYDIDSLRITHIADSSYRINLI